MLDLHRGISVVSSSLWTAGWVVPVSCFGLYNQYSFISGFRNRVFQQDKGPKLVLKGFLNYFHKGLTSTALNI